MQIEVTINKEKRTLDIDWDDLLADVLRRYGYLSIRKGCNTSSCGLCTVWVEDQPVLSCTIPAIRVMGKNVTTIEGVAEEAHHFAEFLIREGAEQCGYCSPGFIMTVLAMKKELKNPQENDIVHYLTGNLCRCSGYVGQLRAVKKYLGVE